MIKCQSIFYDFSFLELKLEEEKGDVRIVKVGKRGGDGYSIILTVFHGDSLIRFLITVSD